MNLILVFFSLFVNSMQTGQFDSTDRALVTAIAEECPIVGGTVVFSARKFLEYFDQEFIWHEDEVCDDPMNRSFTENNITASEIILSPNPTTGFLNILTSHEAKFSLNDITGKKIMDGRIAKGSNQFYLNNLENGIYLLVLEINGKISTEKIIIQK